MKTLIFPLIINKGPLSVFDSDRVRLTYTLVTSSTTTTGIKRPRLSTNGVRGHLVLVGLVSCSSFPPPNYRDFVVVGYRLFPRYILVASQERRSYLIIENSHKTR